MKKRILLKEYIENKINLFLFNYEKQLNEAEGNVQDITRDEAISMIKNSKGAFFTVVFNKKNGMERTMNARLGVKKYLRGGSLPYNPEAKGVIPVYDLKKNAYRMINKNTIKSLKIGNNFYNVK